MTMRRCGIGDFGLAGAALAAILAAGAGMVGPASAAPTGVETADAGSGGWTLDRMQAAKPVPMSGPEAGAAREAPTSEPVGSPEWGPGADATVELPPGVRLWPEEGVVPGPASAGDLVADEEVPGSSGTSGCPFSSSRLVPPSGDNKFPYRLTGKLFFTIPGEGDYVCSGAVLRPRVVLTAGHCVHRGSGGNAGYHTNFLFCPAWRNGPSRYGCWNMAYVAVTSDWYDSGGTFPNAADFAMMESVDQTISGVPTKLGSLVGYFGYSTLALSSNHVHMLGYPVGFDGGNRMHQVTSGRCYAGGSNTERYGSDMRGGSSGGPWVQDFGAVSNGQTVSSPSGPNLVVGVTSYLNLSTDPKYLGSSVPDARFTGLLTMVCNHRAGNC